MAGQGFNLNRSTPVIDFTALDFDDVKASLIAFAQEEFSDLWTDFNDGQLGTVMLDVLSYQFDLATFYMNALLNETFVQTAVRRQNILNIGKNFDFTPPGASPAVVTMSLTLDPGGSYPQTLLANTEKVSNSGSEILIYMPVSDTIIPDSTSPFEVIFIEGDQALAEALGTSDGTAAQRFQLANTFVLFQSPNETLTVRVNGVPWTSFDSLADMLSSDQGYLVEVNDANEVFIIFGDGINGQIPPNTQAIDADYKFLEETRPNNGNLGSTTITSIVDMPSEVTAVTNPDPATGGTARQTDQQVRVAIPASLRVKTSVINEQDMADAAIQVAGVAKARGAPGDPLIRTILLFIAPSGGGQPSDILKNEVNTFLRPNKVVGQRISTDGPTFKLLRIALLMHVKTGFRQADVSAAITNIFTNAEGTGIFDFDQMNFKGLDANGDPQASIEVLQDTFIASDNKGVRRVEVETLDIVPVFRRLTPTVGDGDVTGVTTPTNDTTRREWFIEFTSTTTFSVKERIIGQVGSIADAAITDDTQTFPLNLFSLGFTILNPDRRTSSTLTVATGNTETTVPATVGGMFLETDIGADYFVERSVAAAGTVGIEYTAIDSAGASVLVFTVNQGSVGNFWSSGDEIIIDTYPPVADIDSLRNDEIMQLELAQLTIRLAGGIQT